MIWLLIIKLCNIFRILFLLMVITSQTIYLLFFFFNLFHLFYFWLCWVFVAACRISLVVASGGHSSLQCMGPSLWWLLLLQRTGSRRVSLSSRGTWAQQLWLMGLVAPRHVGSSQTRARTRVPCIGRRTPNHCVTREAPIYILNLFLLKGILQFIMLYLKIFCLVVPLRKAL